MLEQIRDKAEVDIVHVPYKGGGQIFTDAVGPNTGRQAPPTRPSGSTH